MRGGGSIRVGPGDCDVSPRSLHTHAHGTRAHPRSPLARLALHRRPAVRCGANGRPGGEEEKAGRVGSWGGWSEGRRLPGPVTRSGWWGAPSQGPRRRHLGELCDQGPAWGRWRARPGHSPTVLATAPTWSLLSLGEWEGHRAHLVGWLGDLNELREHWAMGGWGASGGTVAAAVVLMTAMMVVRVMKMSLCWQLSAFVTR